MKNQKKHGETLVIVGKDCVSNVDAAYFYILVVGVASGSHRRVLFVRCRESTLWLHNLVVGTFFKYNNFVSWSKGLSEFQSITWIFKRHRLRICL